MLILVRIETIVFLVCCFFVVASSVGYAQSRDQGSGGIFGEPLATGQCSFEQPQLLLNDTLGIMVTGQGDPAIAVGTVSWNNDNAVLAFGSETIIIPVAQAKRCDSASSNLVAAFGETLTLFFGMDQIVSDCANSRARRCLESVMNFVDVSGDERASQAELARAARALTSYVSYEIALAKRRESQGELTTQAARTVPLSVLYGGTASSVVLAPYISSHFLKTYDFDADGAVSVNELIQDREDLDIQALAASMGIGIGADGIVSFVSSVTSSLGSTFGKLLSSGFF